MVGANSCGHPAPGAAARPAHAGAKLFAVMDCGAVQIRTENIKSKFAGARRDLCRRAGGNLIPPAFFLYISVTA